MTLQSMTGFSRSHGDHDTGSWAWEIRSVNNKGLDVRLRLPHGFESIEQTCKKKLTAAFSRGSLQANLQFSAHNQTQLPCINEQALEAILNSVQTLQNRLDLPPPTIEGLFALKGVIELQEPDLDEAQLKSRHASVQSGLDQAIEDLKTARSSEGAQIAGVLSAQIDEIQTRVEAIIDDPARSADAIRERLKQQVASLLEASDRLEEQRLYQEAAILATKADLREELDRLQAHISAARELLSGVGPVGRKLDFLAQEFNRECNTICSKSNANSVTALGLELKVIVDQLREQVQNLE